MNYYSPHTGELIETATPSDWMGKTDATPPAFDRATQGCFFRNDAWVIVDAVAPVEPAPTVVTMRQARLALLGAGMLAQVNTAVAAMPGAQGDAARIEWDFSGTVDRNSPLVQSLVGVLGLSDTQLDALFKAAGGL